jgi:hypothetical protein
MLNAWLTHYTKNMLKLGIGLDKSVKKITAGTAIDPDAQAFFNRVTAAGGSLTATEQTAVNTLVLDLKGFSLWTSIIAIYPMVGSSAASCAQNLKSSSFTGSFTSGWTFATTGATPNGAGAYMDTICAPIANLSQNSTHIAYYSRTNNIGVSYVEMGLSTPNAVFIAPRYDGGAATGNAYRAVNSTQTSPTLASINTAAFFQANRISATQIILYRNNTAIFTDTLNSTGLSNVNIYVGAYNGGSGFTTRQCAFASIGAGMTTTEQGNYYTSIQAFQTTLSRQV